ncbi:MAG: lysine--tRNA ligase, partial [Ruminococcaceae bacterium]|nr:lysine--tRNA ligase [Oscillospiraceae bacterium]
MSENFEQNNTAPEVDLNEVLKVRREKLSTLMNDGENPFEVTKFDRTNTITEIIENYSAFEGKTVTVAGRMMSKRVMGKMSFADLRDGEGKIQLCVKRDEMGEDHYAKYKKFDIGDIIGVTGEVFTTQRGEMSIRTSEIKLLSKSLRPLPEKFHG